MMAVHLFHSVFETHLQSKTKHTPLAEYVITMPNMYARGILFGKMVLELGDTCMAKNEKNGLYCDLEFKTKVRLHFLSK
jgi:hypothetical protein